MKEFEPHPLATIFPPATPEQHEQLTESIGKHGLREPITLYESKILDGRNRYRALAELEEQGHPVEWQTENFLGTWEEAKNYVYDMNRDRRHLRYSQRAAMAVLEKRELQKSGKVRLGRPEKDSEIGGISGEAAEIAARDNMVGKQAVYDAERVFAEAPEIFEVMWEGGISLREALREIEGPHVARNTGDNEWYTPAEYIEAAHQVMGGIDLDPASTEEANRVVGAKRYFTAEQDGLAQPWEAQRVWLNPPYDANLVPRFADKLIAHYAAGDVSQAIVLVNNATETRWFQSLLFNAASVLFPLGRVRFWHPRKESAPLQGQAVLYLGKDCERFRDAFGGMGVVCNVVRQQDG